MESVESSAAATADAPVLNVINKRIRNLRKKYKRIIQIEEAVAQGKSINKEQEDVLQSKIGVCVTIDELEKLRAPLAVAVSEEIDLAFQRRKQEEEQASAAAADEQAAKAARITNEEQEEDVKVTAVETVRKDDVEDLLNLIYFGALFDVKTQNDFTSTMFTRTLERNCCLTYDYVTDDATDMLGERDLSMISMLVGLVTSRPGNSSLSHKNAIQQCIEHAKHWIANSDRPIDSDSSVTYASLRERLSKIMASEYVTITPEMQAPPVEIGAFQHASMAIPVQMEAKDENAENHQGHEADNNHPKHEVELQNQKEEYVIQNAADANEIETDEYQRDEMPKDQQFIHRRPYSNQRSGRGGGGGGGGYNRGYSNGRGRNGNGRGGGPYQNGRNQSYDQQHGGNYHQKNSYNNRARVGRDGAGGNSFNNHGSAGSAGYAPSVDVGSGYE